MLIEIVAPEDVRGDRQMAAIICFAWESKKIIFSQLLFPGYQSYLHQEGHELQKE